MSNSIGQIALDFILNKGSFNRDLKSVEAQAQQASTKISNSFKKIGLAVAGAFSVKAIVNFGKECINLGSDLAEVQNVVDVTFTTMSNKVNSFAQNAMTSYGLSETIAKKFVGTFGAMAKSYGFTEQQSYDMATALTGLAGDVASFYNLSQDEAYTKIKSVFTGETESLKDLGVVMTQTSLDSFALANGFGKTTSAMTEAEKVSLRYAFVQQQLAGAQGDFTRTSDSWANQVRVLQLRFDSLKATIGQGLINVLTPVIKVINNLMASLSGVAEKFKAFTEQVFGFSSGGSGATESISTIADGATDSSQAFDGVTKSAEKAKRSVAGFDKLNVLSAPDKSSASSSGSSASVPTSNISDAGANVGNKLASNIQNAFKSLYEKSGFKTFVEKIQKGIDRVNWSKIGSNFTSIFNNLKPIATKYFEGIENVAESAFGTIGSFVGGNLSIIGKSIETISGGVANWLETDKVKIINFIDEITNNVSSGYDNLSVFFDEWYGLMGDSIDRMRPTVEKSLTKLLSGFTTFGGNIGKILSKAFDIASENLAEWVQRDAPVISEFFDSFQIIASDTMSEIGTIFEDIGSFLGEWWESEGAVIFDSICTAFTNLGTTLMNVWNEWIMPVWGFIVGLVQSAWDNCLKPIFEKAVQFFGKIGECISVLWNTWLSPIVNWLVNTAGPIISNALDVIKGVFDTFITYIGDTLEGFLTALNGLIDFITGVFSGDWEQAWKGVKNIVKGVWDTIWGAIKGVVNLIIDGLNTLWSGVYTVVSGIVNTLSSVSSAVGWLFGQDWSFEMPTEPPLIPKLAKGGIIKAPTLALVGDNPGANTGDPEVVSPLSKLQGMIDNSSNGYDIQILTQILDYLKKLYELFIVFKNNGGNAYQFVAELNGSTLFEELVYQNELYKKRHNGKSAFA